MDTKRGPKLNSTNKTAYNKFKIFYDNEFKNLITNKDTKISSKNLSQIIEYSTVDMITNIENNIKLNFFKYLRRYVNESTNSEQYLRSKYKIRNSHF